MKSRRKLSTKPSAIRARERRLDRMVEEQEKKMYAEIGALMAKGMTFDEAWVANVGLIIPLVWDEMP